MPGVVHNNGTNLREDIKKVYKTPIAICSTVCKSWYQLISQPLTCPTINIYSKQQLKRCIQMAKEKTINNKPIGNYIQHLIFHFYCELDKEGLFEIAKTVLNVCSIKGSMYVKETFYYVAESIDFPQLQQLTHFEQWYKAFNKTWMTTLINNDKIESVDIMMDKNKVNDHYLLSPVYVKYFDQSTLLPSYAHSIDINRAYKGLSLPYQFCNT
ncbi:unnamed protein product [Cunninghamella echinulata]